MSTGEWITTSLSAIAVLVAAWAAVGASRAASAAEGLLAAQLQPRVIDVPKPIVTPPDLDRPMYPGDHKAALPRIGEIVMTVTGDRSVGLCSIPIRNVGPGLAHIREVRFDFSDGGSSEVEWRCSKQFIPSGESARVSLSVFAHHPSIGAFHDVLSRGSGAVVRLRYSPADDGALMESSFHLRRGEEWHVGTIEFSP